MGIYRRGKIYWFNIMQDGKRTQVSSKTKNKRLAEKIYAKTVIEIQEGRWFEGVKAKKITIAELLQKFMDERLKNKALKTISRDWSLKKHIENHFGRYSLAEVTSEMISDYRQNRYAEGKAIATVNRELGFLRHAYNVAIKHYKWCAKNPVSDVKFDQENNLRDKWLTLAQEEHLISELSGRYRDIVRLVINTGMRRDEVLSLTHPQVDFNRRVTIIQGKGNKVRTIPLNQVALNILKDRLKTRHIKSALVFPSANGTKIQKNRLLTSFKRALSRIGISDFTFHDLRHTFATRLAQTGVDLYVISKLLGHNNISTTQRYAHHCPESLRHGVEVLENCYKFATVSNSDHKEVKAGAI
jgi:site-specific recombinase XerD